MVRCKNCKDKISKELFFKFYGFCSDNCKSEFYNKKNKNILSRKLNKIKNTTEFALTDVKDNSETRFWSSSHKNCFRCTIGKGENDEHIFKKFERWLYHRKKCNIVFTELRLKNGMGRPDLLIIDNKGNIIIEEIVNSEKEESLIKKKNKYPYDIKIIRTK